MTLVGALVSAAGVVAVAGGHLALGGLVALGGASVALAAIRRWDPPPPRRARVAAMGKIPVPPRDALDDLPWPTTACPACGFLDLRMRGRWLTTCECPRCGYYGVPAEFKDADAFVAFLSE